jgi:hypothetical protein
MKHFLLALFSLVIFTSCQKELTNDPTTPPPTTGGGSTGSTGSMTAKIDGQPWVADLAAGADFSPALGQLPPLVNITGLGKAKKHLTITLTDSMIHNYLLSPDNLWMNAASYIDSTQANAFNYSTNQSYIPNEPNGSVKITSIDTVKKTISGTFNFKVYRQMDSTKHTITDGVFTNITYTKGFGVPASSATDTFKVKINGTPLAPYSITGSLIPIMNQLNVQAATQNQSDNVSLVVPSTITPGTYTLDFFGATYIGTYMQSGNGFPSVSGTLQILEHNTSTKRIRGNFNFVAQPFLPPVVTHQITEGYFSVKYQ